MTTTQSPTTATDRMVWSFNMLMDLKATAAETGGALTVIDTRLTAASNPPMHVHRHADEAFYILEGEIEFFLGDDLSKTAVSGDFVFGPRGVPHRFEVRSPQARMLILGTPGGSEHFFADLGEPAAVADLPTPQPPDVERVIAVAGAHDIEILLPPT